MVAGGAVQKYGPDLEGHQQLLMAAADMLIEIYMAESTILRTEKIAKNNGEYKVAIGEVIVKVDPKYYRPTEVELLIGDPTKAMSKLGWKPKYDLAGLVQEMVASDLTLFKKDILLMEAGHAVYVQQE